MGVQWTEEQQEVIRHREGNLLVAAAAGSGKTAVLVEHILERLTDPADPVSLSELVVMTFTDAAAQEMRERLRKGLLERLRQEPGNERLIREAGSIQNADISTIDAFCKRLITENYAVIGLDPAFRLGEEGELKLLKGDVIRDLLEARYEMQDEAFLRFADSYTRGKDDSGLEELILRVFDYASANPWPEEYLADAENGNASAEEYLLEDIRLRLRDFCAAYRYALEICQEEDGPESYLPTLEEELRHMSALAKAENLPTLAEGLQAITFGRLKSSKSEKKGLVTNVRNGVKKELQALQKLLVLPPAALQEKIQQGMAENVHVLVELTRDFMVRFREEKTRRRMLDFSDLEHFALQILYTGEGEERRPSAIADDYAKRLREILVDEYQDSNYVQEALVEALSAERFGRPDVFQVGDVKQSIYSFRLARPELFLSKYKDPQYPTITLSQNFRSCPEVLDAANAVFFRVMQEEVGGILYTEESSLHPGRILSEEEKALSCPAELHLVSVQDSEMEEAMDKTEAETRVIASRIKKLRTEGIPYRDMVILLRSPGSIGDEMVTVLGNEGIPAYCVSREGYFTAVEVEIVLSVLSIINNPRQSIPLAAVLRSPIYGFTDEELAELAAKQGGLERRFPGEEELWQQPEDNVGDPEAAVVADADGASKEVTDVQAEGAAGREAGADSEMEALSPALAEKLEKFYEQLAHFRELSQYLSIHELLYRIYDETGYYNYVSAQPAGERRRANLDQLIDSALAFENTSYRGLFDFIRYIEKLKKYSSDQGEASVLSEQNDLVRIMSIHKSKGLQFPVVFLAGLGRRINKMDLSGNVLIDPVLGIGTDYIDPEKRVRYPSMQKLGIREKLARDQLGEELRVLYVAMTRAENRLILSGTCTDPEKAIESVGESARPLSGSNIRSASCLLDWVIMALGERLWQSHSPLRLYTESPTGLREEKTEELKEIAALAEDFQNALFQRKTDTALQQEMQRRFTYRYPHEAATTLFPKHTVSEIKARAAEQEGADAPGIVLLPDHSGSSEAYVFPEQEIPDGAILDGKMSSVPEEDAPSGARNAVVGREKTGSARGTAYHKVLAQYDFAKGEEQLEALPEEVQALVNLQDIRHFLQSPLGQRLRQAAAEKRLFREQRFMKQVSYNYLFRDSDVTEPVLLQGVADAFILEEEGILLLDYKTDRVRTAETLRRRYSLQLQLYADALSDITGRPVKEKLLYSFALQQTVSC